MLSGFRQWLVVVGIVLTTVSLAACDGAEFAGGTAKATKKALTADDSKKDDTATENDVSTDIDATNKTTNDPETIVEDPVIDPKPVVDPEPIVVVPTRTACVAQPAIIQGRGFVMKMLTDGGFLVAGTGRTASTPNDDAAIWKFDSDAKLVTSYATGGKFFFNAGGGNAEIASHLEVFADGSAIGNFQGTGIKLSASGVRDMSFSLPANLSAFVRLQNNEFVGAVAGSIFKFNDSGQIDNTFGTAGYASITDVGAVQGLALAAGNRILVLTSKVVGTSPNNWGLHQLKLTRLNTNGSLDATFATGGEIVFADQFPKGVMSGMTAFKVLTNGEIVVSSYTANYTLPSPRTDSIVYLLDANGVLLNSFGASGRFTKDFSTKNNYDQLNAVDEFADGKLMFVGWSMDADQEIMLTHMDRKGDAVAPINHSKFPLLKVATDYLYDIKITSADTYWAVGGVCSYVYLAQYNKLGVLLKTNQPGQ